MTWLLTLTISLVWTWLLLGRYRHSALSRISCAFFICLFVVLSAMYIAADYFTGNGVDNSVMYHLGYGLSGAGFSEYAGIITLCIALVLMSLLLARWSYRRLGSGVARPGPKLRIGLALGLFPLACLLHPTSLDLAMLYGASPISKLFSWTRGDDGGDAAPSRFEEFYRTPPPTAEREPLNLVFLYLESLERTYFDETRFPGLTNELKALEKESLSFTDIRGSYGAGFTIGGMVASQCGIPLVASSHPNSMSGMDRFLPGAICLGDMLNARGYQLDYMGGASLSFAGKGKFYKNHGFNQVRGLDELIGMQEDPTYRSYWGLYDDSTLAMVYQRYQELAGNKSPFALIALTLDTHHPDGHPSKACEGRVYADGSNPILNAVHCTDLLASRFIRKILDSSAANNTLLVVASDHLALRNSAYDELTSGKRTNLLMIFDPARKLAGENPKPGTTLDTTPTVMSLMGLKLPAHGLGRDLNSNLRTLAEGSSAVNGRLKQWQNELGAFWEVPSAAGGIKIDSHGQIMEISDRKFLLPVLIEFDDDGEISTLKFEQDSPEPLITYVEGATADRLVAWVDRCEKVRSLELSLNKSGYCLFLGKMGAASVLLQELSTPLHITPQTLASYAAAPISPELASTRSKRLSSTIQYGVAGIYSFTEKLSTLEQEMQLEIRSSGGTGNQSGQILEGRISSLSRGLHLFGISSGGSLTPMAQLDPCADSAFPEKSAFAENIGAGRAESAAYLIMVHDSAVCGASQLQPIFSNLPLERWRDLQLRTPYLAILPSDGSEPLEILGEKNSSLQLTLKGTHKSR
jgi:phosphoglycerol transferase